ncbi:hypothetical protein TWF730_003560 [Orbilia blumenaviensis]|uniref:Uncharacterized protein n=1 Tax=Orbilia blumenaviensis TaxID=1796055 RepID=A0AAV9U4R4_9PEZI
MAYLGTPPQTYWPSQFVDPAFDPELADPSVGIHDAQQTSLPPHSIQPADNAHHILDPALSDEMPPQGQHPIIFHQTSPHSYAPPPPFEQQGLPPPAPPPPPPPDQLYSPGRIRPPTAKEIQSQHSGEVVMDDGHGAAYIAPAQHPFLGNNMHHPDMHQPLGQPPQIKFRATPNNPSNSGGHGRRPKMTKEEQMARRRLRTDTDEYRTQERERMRRRRAREKEEREKHKREQEDQLRAEGKESWIAPATKNTTSTTATGAASTTTTTTTTITDPTTGATTITTTTTPGAASNTPKRKTVKMIKKKAPVPVTQGPDGPAEEDDEAREARRQAKVDNRAGSHEPEDGNALGGAAAGEEEEVEQHQEEGEEEEGAFEDSKDEIDDTLEEEHQHHIAGEQTEEMADHQEDESGEVVLEEAGGEEETADNKEPGARGSVRRTSAATPAKAPASSKSARAATAKGTPAKSGSRPARGRAAEPEKIVQEVTTTRSGRTTRSALSTPKTAEKKDSPVPQSAPPAPVPLKITTRKQTVTTPASPSSPAISKTRVSLKSLSTTVVPAPLPTDAKSPSSIRPPMDSKSSSSSSSAAPVVMLFGYPAGVNPPCEVSSVSVTVESTKTNKICMMTAADMRRPATPPVEGEVEEGDKMDIDEVKETVQDNKEEQSAPDDKEPEKEKKEQETEKEKEDEEKEPEKEKEKEEGEEKTAMDVDVDVDALAEARKSSSPDGGDNGRFSWDLVVRVLKADIGFDPSKDELVGFHHKDPLLLSCDRHLNTAMVMAAKEGVRMLKWYVYEKQQ